MPEDGLASVFEERAEYLSEEDLRAWTQRTPRDSEILSRLIGPGPKLLTGPRGSGKSTYLRLAYFKMLEEGQVLPIYVNYGKSLALEPLFHQKANALALFRQWVLAKIIAGVPRFARESLAGTPFDQTREIANRQIRSLEAGQAPNSLEFSLSPSELVDSLEEWAAAAGRRRVVLLLDDAAHAFSSDQQREFFGIYRDLRSRYVAPKAAVYPGVTTYTPTFHIGHDAEMVEAWMRPDDDEYLPVMRGIAERRLPEAMRKRLEGREELLDLLALASFGLPRGFILMLSSLLGVEEAASPRITRSRADAAISEYASNTRDVFKALAVKLPRFKNFVELGMQLQSSMIASLQRYNRGRAAEPVRATIVAIGEPVEEELKRILALLEYAGIIRRMGSVSRGEQGSFERYWVHHALLLSENGLALGRNPSTASALRALTGRNAQLYPRTKGAQLLGPDFRERCTLDLPPCGACGEPRLSAEARYCMKCGSRLTEASIYKELLSATIDALPITPNKIDSILVGTNLRTVQDILLDDEATQLRSVPYIGPVWAERIRRAAEEFVYV
ncbi:hypothetical protein [Micromonospora endophytica]|uniref:hypothetical protein n=1 Tax=Micromonospora endophytica TaxID=515350 RepID=UPI0011B4E5E5|nr:hypothetical protein [Micromonospora endophytica]BCJ61611.1 hypothetical protein Jiend_50330 [Micromonospora endophytica]